MGTLWRKYWNASSKWISQSTFSEIFSNRRYLRSELKTLPDEQHLFCPRLGSDDGSVYFDEDIANLPPDNNPAAVKEREAKIKEAEERKWIALEALQIVAYDGDEAAPHKEWLLARLNGLMTSCDICVRVFHQSKAEWKNRLIEYAAYT